MSSEDVPQSQHQESDERSQQTASQQSERSSSRRFQNQSRRENSAQQRHVGQAVNMEELRELVELVAAYGFTDFELEREGFRVRLRRELAANQTAQTISPAQTAAAPVSSVSQQSTTSQPPSGAPAEGQRTGEGTSTDQDLHTITSPIVGTFYRASSPTAEPFVRAGVAVEPETIVCIIEAMKLMNEIQAETSGVIEKIYVENAQPVEYGQPLFGVRK